MPKALTWLISSFLQATRDFERRVEKLNEKRNEKRMSITSQLSCLKTELQNYKVQVDRKKMIEFRNAMREIVFPCSPTDSDYYFYQEPKKGNEENPFN